MTSAYELADMLEMGEGKGSIGFKLTSKTRYHNNLQFDMEVMSIRHSLEEEMMNHANCHMHPDCWFRHYDWDGMYEEDAYCDDKDYIPKLTKHLRKKCECPNHK